MERSFHSEIEALKLGQGEIFQGEGILAVTKALLQSGVTYVGGYQGSPISHLLDVMVQAKPYMDELGVHVEACTNESSAAAMLAASIMYPVRGAVTWKSVVGTNVASDALSNLASPGVMGGAVIVVGEDYGEGASVIQERTHAFAMKSALWLMDPRPNLPTIVRMTEKAFELSEASNTPVMIELRIRACHVQGSFVASDNIAPAISSRLLQQEAAGFSYDRLSHPPSTFRHEKHKYEVRMPAARRFIEEQIRSYEQKLAEAENRLKEFRLRNMALLGAGTRDYISQIGESNEQLRQARLELKEAEDSRDALRQQLVGGQSDSELQPPPMAATRRRPSPRR